MYALLNILPTFPHKYQLFGGLYQIYHFSNAAKFFHEFILGGKITTYDQTSYYFKIFFNCKDIQTSTVQSS